MTRSTQINRILKRNWPFALLLIGLTAFGLYGYQQVPFHPDESTYLYMSADYEVLLTAPASLAWEPGTRDDPRIRYRTIDAPLTRYLIGLGRSLMGLGPLSADWDWSASWDANLQSGAVPKPELLAAARLAITLLLPLSITFLYLTGKQIGGRLTGLVGAFLLGINSLTLLHARRAMAEGVLVFGITFFLWSLIHGGKRPWLAGLGTAIAYNAKHSALALFPVGLLAVLWLPDGSHHGRRFRWANLLSYAGVFAVVTILLNPFLWKDPIQAFRSGIISRQELLENQIRDFGAQNPALISESPGKRAAVMAANLFILPPSFAEAANYSQQTAQAEVKYLAIPGHQMLRGLAGGGILFILTIFGLVLAIRVSYGGMTMRNRRLVLLLAATVLQLAALILAIPLPFQRYSMPLVPFASLWTGFGVGNFVATFKREQHQDRTK